MSASIGQNGSSFPRQESGLRYIVESLVSLALAVLLVRSFAVEGYIISTGSMAPFLLGYHKQVVCPSCRFPFAVGIPVEDDHDTSGPVACLNCGQGGIDLASVPRNEGDQLLVQKFAYLFRQPKRWEVAVFQNPNHPTQAYVKRVIGLPGEEVQIRAGDVWINGELARKNLNEQRSTRMAVCSQRHRPANDQGFRWLADEGWTPRGSGFEFSGTGDSEVAWVTYLGEGSSQNAQEGDDPAQRWPADDYAYNGLIERTQRYRVRDLMLATEFELHSGRGDLEWAMSDGSQIFVVRLAAGDRKLKLFIDGANEPEEEIKLSGSMWQRKRLVEMSLFDRQLLFAIDGEVIFQKPLDPLTAGVKNESGLAKNRPPDSVPVQFGARGVRVSLTHLTLYRADVAR